MGLSDGQIGIFRIDGLGAFLPDIRVGWYGLPSAS